MKVYLLLNKDNFLGLSVYDFEMTAFNGMSKKDVWVAPTVGEYNKKGKKYDFCNLLNNPMFNDYGATRCQDSYFNIVKV